MNNQPVMMKSVVTVAGFLLITMSGFGQTVPLNAPGGAVTVQPGAVPANSPGTIQPQAATPTGPTATTINSAVSPDGRAPAPALTVSGFKRFGDPLLESLIRLGLDNSPNLRAALSRVEEARIRVKIAESFLSPSLRSSALVTTQSLSERRPLSVPNQADLLPRFQLNTFQFLPIDASYEVDLFKRIRRTINVADLQAQASEADFQSFRLTLASDIARTYLLIRGNDAEQAAFVRNIQARDSTLAILRERFRAGLISQIDVQRAETDYATLQVTLRGCLARASSLSMDWRSCVGRTLISFRFRLVIYPIRYRNTRMLLCRSISCSAVLIYYSTFGKTRSLQHRCSYNRPVRSHALHWSTLR